MTPAQKRCHGTLHKPLVAEPIEQGGCSCPPTFGVQWASAVACCTTFLSPNWLFFHFILSHSWASGRTMPLTSTRSFAPDPTGARLPDSHSCRPNLNDLLPPMTQSVRYHRGQSCWADSALGLSWADSALGLSDSPAEPTQLLDCRTVLLSRLSSWTVGQSKSWVGSVVDKARSVKKGLQCSLEGDEWQC